MEIRHHEYSLLAVSRFNVYILKAYLEDHTPLQKIYILRSQDVIQAASLVISPQHLCRAIIASKTTLWSVSLPVEGKDNDIESKRPSKKRKLAEASMDHEDIFADLLGEKDTEHVAEINMFQKDLSTQQNVFSLSLNEKQRLCSLDSEIIDIAVCDETLVALVGEETFAYIKIFVLGDEKARCIQTIPIEIEARFFCPEFKPNLHKQVHLVVNQHVEESAKAHTTSGALNLPTSFFTLLFGKEAACLRSPVVLLCDIKGCVYFYQIKSLMPQPKRLMMLCEATSQIVSISKVEFDSWPEEKTSSNDDTIALLESALSTDRDEKKHKNNFPITGLLALSETGQCCMFLPNEVAREAFIFHLPHSTHSCIVKGSRMFYATETRVEVCDVIITRQNDNGINVAVEKKVSLFTERMTHLVSVSKICSKEDKDVIVGVSDELKLVLLPLSEDKPMEPPSTDSTVNTLMDSDFKCITDVSGNTGSAQTLIDSCLLQLNLFASIVKQERALLQAQSLKSEDIVVTCNCSVLSKPSAPFIWFQVHLTNTTSVSMTKDWKVSVNVVQKTENISTAPRHFMFPLPHGLPPKSTKEIIIPIPSPSISNLRPFELSVSLVLTPNVSFSTIKKWPSHVDEPLIVKIHQQCFDILDYLQLTSSTDPAVNCRRTDELCSTVQGSSTNNSISPELAKCLLSIPRTCSLRNLGEEMHTGSTQTFTMTLHVPDVLCKELHPQTAVDIVRLVVTQDSKTDARQLQQPQVQFKTPAENIQVSVAVAENPAPMANSFSSSDAKQERKKSSFMVTLRSSSLALLMATRAAVKARLESRPFERSNDVIPLSSRVRLHQQLQRYERLSDELVGKCSKPSGDENLYDDIHVLCDLFDKNELIQ